MIAIIIRNRKVEYILIICPVFINMLGLTFTIPVQDFRYNYAAFLLFFYVLTLFNSRFIFKKIPEKE